MKPFAALGKSLFARHIKPFFPLLVYAAVAALLATIYFTSIRHIEALILQEKLDYLGAIAEDKAGQIEQWHVNQQKISTSFARNSLLATEFRQWLREGAPPNGRRRMLLQRLAELQQANGYHSVSLLDRQGRILLSLPAAIRLNTDDLQLARLAMDSRETVFSDFHRGSGEQTYYIELMEPLTGADRLHGGIEGVVAIKIDPAQFLYPLIKTWPVPSASGETLLVRQEGGQVLFLNELRHRQGTAHSLRIPLAATNPAAMALRGERRTTDGIDYRGMPVVAEMSCWAPSRSWGTG
jgi:hypothetical protein